MNVASRGPGPVLTNVRFQSLIVPLLVSPPSYPCREIPQLEAVLGHLSRALLQEGHRLKAWGVLGTGTGAELLRPGEPCSVSARAPGKPGLAESFISETLCRRGKEEENETKWKPPGL